LVTIATDNVGFSYNSTPVLHNVTFALKTGTILALVGPNGSGKTTLIRCIDRILHPEGSILINEQNLHKMSRNDIATTIGYVPQNGAKIAAATVFDVVMMGRTPHMSWRLGDGDIDRIEYAIRLLGIEELAERDYNELSGGQQQKVLIARAVAQDPKILLLDEPTNSLDIHHQLEALATISDLSRSTGLTVVMAVHDLSIAARYADMMMMLKNGAIVAIGAPENLITPDRIREVFGVEARILHDPEAGLIVAPLRAVAGGVL
jgi:ABC-type cobalamin/Fe3+-siderophores transport systems, ATPase components